MPDFQYENQAPELEWPTNIESSTHIVEFFRQRQLDKGRLRRVAEFLDSPEGLLVREFLALKDHNPEFSWSDIAKNMWHSMYQMEELISKELKNPPESW